MAFAPLLDIIGSIIVGGVILLILLKMNDSTVENHYLNGGLASLVAEIIAQRALPCRLVPCGVKAIPNAAFGGQNYLRHAHGLSSQVLVDTALKSLNETKV